MKWFALALILAFVPVSCDDDSGVMVSVKDIEFKIYQELKSYRNTKGLDGPFVHQVLIVEEAQRHSHKMAVGVAEVDTMHFQEHWEELAELWHFYNRTGLVLETSSSDAGEILLELLAQPGAEDIILGDLSQCGVGTASGDMQQTYVTVFLAKSN